MDLSERLDHMEQHHLDEGDKYGAEVLHRARTHIAQLETDLADSSAEIVQCHTELEDARKEIEGLVGLSREILSNGLTTGIRRAIRQTVSTFNEKGYLNDRT